MTIHSDNTNKEEIEIEKRVEKMESKTFDIEFSHEGKPYKGWATPSSEKGGDDSPKSFHVVLNEVFFGNLHLDAGKWETDSQREDSLIQATGKQIENYQKNLENRII